MIIVLTGSDIFSGDNRFDNSTDWGETFSVVIIGVIIVVTGTDVFCGYIRCDNNTDSGTCFL